METVSLRLAPEMIAALEQIARQEDVTLGGLVRDAVKRDLYRRSRAKTARRADERLVAPLRALLADDLAYATGWSNLQDRLGGKGYRFQEAGGGLALHDLAGKRICKGSDLGYSYSKLMRRFGAPFPGHTHHYLYRKSLVD